MSFVMNAIARYRATAGLYDAQAAGMQGKQNALSNLNNTQNFGSSELLNLDKNFVLGQAQSNFESLAYGTELDSLEQAKKKQAEGFNYFA